MWLTEASQLSILGDAFCLEACFFPNLTLGRRNYTFPRLPIIIALAELGQTWRIYYLLKDFIYLLLEREGEREGEKH